MKPLAVILCLALPLGALAPAQEKSVKPGINDPFKDPDPKEFAGKFEVESRETFAHRDRVIAACKVKPGTAVADVGAGTGLFTRLLARKVGRHGKVYAVDIAPRFLRHIEATCKEAKIDNVKTVRCSPTSCGLEPASIDLAFICDTYHHFEFPQRTLASIHRALRPGGTLVVVDFHRIPGKSREWTLGHVRAGQEVVTKEITGAGFKLVGEEKGLGLKENYFLRFERAALPAKGPRKKASLEFNRDVRPILADKCFHCHGPDRAKRKGDLRLDTVEGGGRVVVPHRPDESELVKRILSRDPGEVMPPRKSGRQLTPAQIAVLRRWVAEGAAWEPHWAYLPPRRPAIPAVRADAEAGNPVDRFLLARLDREGLGLSPEAPRRTLIRRLSLDLTGLPPTPDEVEAFVADDRPDAYDRHVERLLASPRLGERLAYDWLDAARYADSNGYQSDRDRVMWPWRDWAVRAFNGNMPFDRFTVEQTAGDLLPGATAEQKLATGFHRNHPLNGEGGRVAEESRVDYVIDRVDTTGTVFLGLTVGCARCHDHKYDPLKAKEYYRLFAYFNSIDESGAVDRGGNAAPVLGLPTPAQRDQLRRLQAAIDAAQARLNASPARVRPSAQKELKARQDALAAFNDAVTSVMVLRDRPTPRPTHVLTRGVWDQFGARVTPGVPDWLAPAPPNARPNRLTLARWLVEGRNPLTARVAVNRYWQLLFGTGLVRTVEDFGVQGEAPSHPELLDWLAVEFRESGWDLKRLLRLIVTSRAYRQSSRVSAALLERDPGNRLLARGPRFRLPSTTIRDQALAQSGLLVEQVGGPPVKPYQPAGIWEEFSFGYIRYQQDAGPSLYRRSLYTFWRRTVGPTNLFDASTRQVCEVKPTRTNTPLHALVTLNDVTYAEAHRVLAALVLREGGTDRVGWLFRRVTARPPSTRERAVLGRALARLLGQFRADPAAAQKLIRVGESPVDGHVDAAELAAWTGLCSLVMNLDEVITRE